MKMQTDKKRDFTGAMNGEIPSVPITTLAGVTSLTDLLPELPLPTPLAHNTNNKSLLYHHALPEEVKRLLHSSDQNVVSQLVSALQRTNTDNIEPNDNLGTDSIEGDPPELIKAILARDPNAFSGRDSAKHNSNLPVHNEHPSPHQAGPSPCTPGSPARVPQPVGTSFPAGPSTGFQASFLNFAQQNHTNHDNSAVSGRKGHNKGFSKPATVTSPAQASAAPNSHAHENGPTKGRDAVVVLEPIQMNAMLHPSSVPNDSSHKKKKSTRDEESGYNVVTAPENAGKLTLKISKSKQQDRKGFAGSKRRRSEDESSEQHSMNSNDVMIMGKEFAPSLGERVKRRRTKVAYRNDSEDDDVIEIGDEVVMGTKKHRKESRHSRRDVDDDFLPAGLDSSSRSSMSSSKQPTPTAENHSSRQPEKHKSERKSEHKGMKMLKGPVVMLRDCMDYSPTQRKFLTLCDAVMESAEDIDMLDLAADEEDDVGGSNAIVRHSTLVELCSESAKLKCSGFMNLVPYGKLVKVLTILQYNIKDGCRPLPSFNEEDEHLLREIALEKIISAVDAALIALYVMTSKSMPKEVYLEDVIDKLVMMTKVQLQHTVYPEFDPVYRVDPKNKSGYTGNYKAKRARSGGAKNRTVLQLYNKLTEVVSLLAELMEIQTLTDTIILQSSTLSVSPFFVENINELQLNSLKLVTSIFSRYEKHRQLILEDILASLARLPSSKKNLRSYRLNSNEHIQMVTALALQLIQCVVKLPGCVEQGSENEAPKPAENMDSEIIIVTSFEHAMRTAHNFLAVYLKKCTTKGEEDYRPLFENFVYDLLATVNKPEWPAAELLLSLLGRLLVTQFSNKSVDMSLRVASLDYLGIVAARLRKDAVTSKLNEKSIVEIIKQIKGEKSDLDAEIAEIKTEEQKENDEGDEDKQKDEQKDDNEDEKPNSEAEEDDKDEDTKKSKSKKKKKKKGKRRNTRRISSDESGEEDEEIDEDEEEKPKDDTSKVDDSKTQSLQNALLEYLVHNAQNDPALIFARQFYIGQWYKDCGLEVERATRQLQKMKSDRNKDPDDVAKEFEKSKEIQLISESRKSFLLSQVSTKVGTFASFKPSPSRLDYENCCLVTRYLASSRPFSQSFEVYLTQILKVLCETAVAVRTRAMKCLSLVVEADPSILARIDMQRGVHGRLLDHSTSVREAAVELVGKFLLSRPELVNQYYDMLSDRILDTGISVRKRVIKIFRDICVEQADFEKIPEMCVKMIRRVNDEEGIKKLVNETFQTMWFTPVADSAEAHTTKLRTRVMNITDVVNACKETGYEWFEHLLENLLKKEEETRDKPVERACSQLIDCLIEHVLKLEGVAESASGGTCSARLIACVATLHLFCKVKPHLLVRHTQVLQPYLDIKCGATGDYMVIHNVARILELAVPLMEHPSENFLAQLEEDMMKLILKHGMMVLQSCVSCLGAIVNTVTHNYKLVRDCFQKFFGVLTRFMQEHQRNPSNPQLKVSLPTILRSLFTLGLLCRHFDFDSDDFGERKTSVKDKVFEVMYYFITHEDREVRHKALSGIGFFATRHYEFMMGKTLRDLYTGFLRDTDTLEKMRIQVLSNLNHYLIEEEVRMMKAEDEWKKLNKAEDLKEMGDVQSGMASTIIQVYLKQLLESHFHAQAAVRMAALNVIVLVLRQGLVHPVQIVPYLIAMGADCDNLIRIKSDQQLAEIDKKYPGFIQMKAVQGVKMSYRLQEVLQQDRPQDAIRGMRVEDSHAVALCSYIYSLIRGNRGQRRGLLTSMLNLFDDTAKTPLNELIYMADNLAAFPYQCQDEPLFIIHQVDILVSVSGSNVLQSYREIFFPGSTDEETGKIKVELDDLEEDVDAILEKVPGDVTGLQELYMLTQGCLLLLMLKQHMKDTFGFTEVKLQRYSPSDQAKVWDKPLSRKHGYEFDPKPVLELVKKLPLPNELDEEGRRNLVQDYIDFKGLMMSIDPTEEDDDEDAPKPVNTPAAGGDAKAAKPEGAGGEGGAGDAPAAPATARADQSEVIDLDDSGDKEELQAKSRETPLTSSKSSYNRLLTLVTTSSSSTKKDKDKSRHSHKSHHSSSSRKSHSHHSSSSHHRDSSHHHGSSSSHSKSHKKKKNKRRRYSESDISESDNSSDPDWA